MVITDEDMGGGGAEAGGRCLVMVMGGTVIINIITTPELLQTKQGNRGRGKGGT